MRKILLLWPLIVVFVTTGCEKKEEKDTTTKLFNLTSSENTHLDFENTLMENDTINYFKYPYIYMGGGSSIGDVNGDGLQDIFLTGNMVENKLYLNKGSLEFEDITDVAKVGGDTRWATGSAMADVNADGLLDIYVSVSGPFEPRNNLLYINMGNNEDGTPVFEEKAAEYGLDDKGHSTQATFLDYDRDGDLDIYVANYPPTSFKARIGYYRQMMSRGEHEKSSHLYKNNGNETFTDVTEEAGLLSFGLSLSATAADFNDDGFTDLYVSNDFSSPDFFYFNNGDGTFTDQITTTTNQTAFYGMGTDAGDFNNDGLIDLIQVDMTPEDNRRSKANMASMNVAGFWEVVNSGFHYQYMQNALQINRGVQSNGLPFFSNVSQLANVALTDWSWSPLLADFDNDGWKDLMISNGTRRDINHKDYFNKVDKATAEEKSNFDYLDLTENIPSEKIDNYIFRNNGDLTFTHINQEWGFEYAGFSNGASYADLDNDGDLDVIINNIDDKVSLFENRASQNGTGNYLRLSLKGPDGNPLGIGTKAIIHHKDQVFSLEQNTVRGFQSSSEPYMHFGLGDIFSIEQLTIIWPDGKKQELTSVSSNQLLNIEYRDADEMYNPQINKETLFADVTSEIGLNHVHEENRFSDYDAQVLLPHEISKFGPALATGDINNDGLDDFYIGGAKSFKGALYKQEIDGTFTLTQGPWQQDSLHEDVGAVFFDANGDSLVDLYVVSGGNEWEAGASEYSDRLYINNGNGFTSATGSLPQLYISGSCVVPGDYDGDGDLDLFVGGRLTPREYPLPASSKILENKSEGDQIFFEDVTNEIAPDLEDIGLTTSASWMDYDNNGTMDLVVTGEWMPITIFSQVAGEFIDVTIESGLENSTGWWFSMKSADIDNDGDMDLIAGNLGTNYKYKATHEETFDIYANDYDNNKALDIVLGYYNNGTQYPVRGKQCSSEQILAIKVKYKNYDDFAIASLDDIYTETDLANSLHYQVGDFKSGWFENNGDGTFKRHAFPNEAQVSVIQDLLFEDFDGDGTKDLLTAGNWFVSEIETPRADASVGLMMKNIDGKFSAVSPAESGFFVSGDVRGLGLIRTGNGLSVIVANNNDKTTIFKVTEQMGEQILSQN